MKKVTFKEIDTLREHINTELETMEHKFRLVFGLIQNKKTRVSIDYATPEQVQKGTMTRNLITGATLAEADMFLTGFRKALILSIDHFTPTKHG